MGFMPHIFCCLFRLLFIFSQGPTRPPVKGMWSHPPARYNNLCFYGFSHAFADMDSVGECNMPGCSCFAL